MAAPCGSCGGGSGPGSYAAAKTVAGSGGATRYTIQLPNGNRVGDYGSREQANTQNVKSFAGKGNVITK